MAKFSDAVEALLKKHGYGQGGTIMPEMAAILAAIQAGIDEHDHSGGAAGTGTGPAIVDAAALAAAAAAAFLAGFISADAAGRALMAANLFNEATVDGKFVDGAINGGKVKDATLTGAKVATVADVNVVGGVPVVFRITVPSGANGDVDVVSTHKVRAIDAWSVMKGAGTAGSLLTVKNSATAITDAKDVSAAGDKSIQRFGEIDDTQHEVAAGGTLRVSKASTGGDFPGAEVYVLALRVA